MLLQKRSRLTTLPSYSTFTTYSGGKRCFQPDFSETELPGLPSKATGSCRKKLQFSQPVSSGELERGDMNRDVSLETFPPQSSQFSTFILTTTLSGSLALNRLRNPVRECRGEFLHPRNPQRATSTSPQRGIHSRDSGIIPRNEAHDVLILGRDVTNGMENHTRPHSGSTVRRRHSLSHLPSYNTDLCSPTQPLAERARSGLGLDLWASLPESMQRKDELGDFLREASCTPGGRNKEPRERNLELELSLMQFELLSLKQKQMQSSFAHLEKEKTWLKMTRYENWKQNGDLDNKIFHLETELAKTRSYLGETNRGTVFLDTSQKNAAAKKKDVDQELKTLQESSVALKKCMKALEKERDEMAEKLKSAEEEQKRASCQIAEANERATTSLQANQALQKETGRLQALYNSITWEKNQLSAKVISLEEKMNELTLKLKAALSDRERLLQEKVALHQQVQHLTLELTCAQKKQEVFSDQALALHSELVSVKTQLNHQEQEKVVMKEELESTRQVNKELSSEATESCQRLGASLEKLHHLEAENKILNNRNEALENERTQLLGEMEGRPPGRQLNGRNQQEDMAALQESCECLRESQSLLQSEKDGLQTRCLELEAALQHEQEEMVNQLTQQQQVSQYRRGRWEEEVTAAILKTKEEELEKTYVQSQTLSAKVETPLLLQIQLDACKQELELERNRSQALHYQIQLLQSGSQNNATHTNETSLQEVDTELALVREELQKVWDMLRIRDTELEEQQLELESTRSQYTECSSEKQRLEQLVTSLEEEIAEKDQALRHLKQAKDVERTELEVKISTLEQKGQSQTRKPDAKVSKTPQGDKESLKQQQQLVTEQLKGLFRQRKQLQEAAGGKKQPREPKTEGLVETPKSQEVLVMPESIGLPKEGQPEALAAPGNSGEAQSLQQQLKEKTETISSMASEIQALQEKNESLMKAKLRFQQQIQEIRKLPKQWPEKSDVELLVPKLPISLQSAPWSDSLAPSPQSDDTTTFFSPSREDLHLAMQEPPHHPAAEDRQSVISSDSSAVSLPPTRSAGNEAALSALPLLSQATLSESAAVPSIKLSFGTTGTALQNPQGQADTEGALVSPAGSALLSPRPFGPQRPWSPFKFKGSPEPPEN